MPLVYSIKCDTCEFVEDLSDVALFAEREDGTEVVLPHPGESTMAEWLTGTTLDQLRKQKRLRGRSGYLCLSCGTVGYYAKRGEIFEGAIFNDVPEDTSFIEKLKTPVIITRLPDLRCANCNKEALEVAGGTFIGKPDGCVVILLEVFGLIKPRPAPRQPAHLCPRCHTGHIHWKYEGVS